MKERGNHCWEQINILEYQMGGKETHSRRFKKGNNKNANKIFRKNQGNWLFKYWKFQTEVKGKDEEKVLLFKYLLL